MAAPHRTPATPHLISARAARDPTFRDVLAMVMEGRAPADYIEGFWAEVEKMQLDEAEQSVQVLAERNEADRRREKRRRQMQEKEGAVYGSLGEWFEDWKGGKTAVDGLDEERLVVALRRGVDGKEKMQEGVQEEENDEDGEVIDAVYHSRRHERRRSAAGVSIVGHSVGETGSPRRHNGQRAATLEDAQKHSLFGPHYDDDDEGDDVMADGETLQDSSEDEVEPEEDGDTTMLDIEPGGYPER